MTTAAPPVHTGEMATLDESGDSKFMWDRTNADEVAAARRYFNDMIARGFAAFKAKGKLGRKGKQIRKFDPDAEKIIFVPALQGG